MSLLIVFNNQNKTVIRAADGIDKLPHSRRRILWQLQLHGYDDIQLLPCLSLFCTCPLCVGIISCRLAPGCKCSKCSAFYQFGVWNEVEASIHVSLPRKPPTPYVCSHVTDTYVPHYPAKTEDFFPDSIISDSSFHSPRFCHGYWVSAAGKS
jgi:hypothetical protein